MVSEQKGDELSSETEGFEQEEENRLSGETITELKQSKARAKTAFTKSRRALLVLIQQKGVAADEIQEACLGLDLAQEEAMEAIEKLSDRYKAEKDYRSCDKLGQEVDRIEIEYTDAQNRAQEVYDELSKANTYSRIVKRLETTHPSYDQTDKKQLSQPPDSVSKDNVESGVSYSTLSSSNVEPVHQSEHLLDDGDTASVAVPQSVMREQPAGYSVSNRRSAVSVSTNVGHTQSVIESTLLGQDMWKQLKRVTIPEFTGDKRTYQNWKAAFMACVDRAPATAEYKLLQLRQCLGGEALRSIESLGHSAAAYKAAMERLERKFGGHRRQVALYLEEIDNFRPVRPGNSKDLERYADLLDVAIVNLKEANCLEELRDGMLYIRLQKKLPASMLATYHRWLYENHKFESVEVLREWIIQEADFQTRALETIHGLNAGKGVKCEAKTARETPRTFFGKSSLKTESASQRYCRVCSKLHGVWACGEFKQMDVSKRWDCAKKFKLCFRCLGEDHLGQHCTRTRVCGQDGCREVHHRLLHHRLLQKDQTSTQGGETKLFTKCDRVKSEQVQDTLTTSKQEKLPEERVRSTREGDKELSEQSTEHKTTLVSEIVGSVALRTIPVYLKSGNRKLKVNALLDDASTKTYLNSDVASELNLQGKLQKIKVSVLNGQVETFETLPVDCIIESLDGKVQVKVTAFTTGRVTGSMKAFDWNLCAEKWPHLRGLQFHKLGPRPVVDVLIGLDCADLHFSFRDIRGEPGQPVARLTPLGWTCIGPTDDGQQDYEQTNFARTYFVTDETDVSDVNVMLRKFWEIDSSGIESYPVKSEDRFVLNKAQQSVKFVDGRYQISTPWKDDVVNLPNNYPMALTRLRNLEKRLQKNPDVGRAYQETIDKHLEKGYVSQVELPEKTGTVWYLPHFAVVKEDRVTTKTRIVFDASAKYHGVALNDVIFQGPKLQRELFDVLLRFRRYSVALVCDVSEMYLRIELNPQDRPFHRFLWRDMNTAQEPTVYEFNRLVFGVNSSPFLAQFVSQHHAKLYKESHPRAAESILKSTYMDDSMDSVLNDEQGIELYKQLSELWGKADMFTHKWLSNSPAVLNEIPLKDRVQEINLDKDVLPSVKTLGVVWIAERDVFTFKSQFIEQKVEFTKREFLKRVATLFDPLGFVSPFTIRAKMLLQEMWMIGLDWDEKVPSDLAEKITSWLSELSFLSQIEVPRALQLQKEVHSMSLHVFVDASQEAYGAVVYSRIEYGDRVVSIRLITSKSKVAPLQSISIPRLELMGASLGNKLAQSVLNVLEIKKERVIFWSDSMNVLWWIRGCGRSFKPFVANRVGEIQMSTCPSQWRHVPTKLNPADYLSRGVKLLELAKLESWWKGPDYLQKEEKFWPSSVIEEKPKSAEEEVKKKFIVSKTLDGLRSPGSVTMVSLSTQKGETWRLDPKRFSSWKRLTRVHAWVVRFVTNCQRSSSDRLLGEELTVEEITDAERQIIKTMQQEVFSEEYSALVRGNRLPTQSKLLGLCPRLDEDGVMRSDGRLKYAEFLPYDVRFPIILPRKNWSTKLIVKFHHEMGNHNAGTNHTLALISSKYWIVSAREEIIEWEKECTACRRRKAKHSQQIMAPLPVHRLTTSMRAFTKTAVDFSGPFITIQGRGKRREKRYLCLFTCLASRAVHLELAYGLDLDSFMNAFCRMVNRRGLPKEMLSDNGTNFVAADKELRELVSKLLEDPKLATKMTHKGVKWTFNPPYAPHFGGVFETMIKAAKRAITAILGNADVTDEELTTVFTGAEALINSRPLTYQSANPQDDVPLTPNHLLHGQVGGIFAPEAPDDIVYSPKKRWRRLQELTRHFWHRWLSEWVPSLSPRKKWYNMKKDLKVGDIVLMISPDSPRAHWPLAKVIEVYDGKDGFIRSVKVQVGTKQYVRPIVKLCPLELDSP